jgi:hypothetical protein
MAKKLNQKELVDFKKLLMANSNQMDALCQLLIEKESHRMNFSPK